MNSYDPWRVMLSSPPGAWMTVPPPYWGHPFFGHGYPQGWAWGSSPAWEDGLERGTRVFVGSSEGDRFAAKASLDEHQYLHAEICVDGKCYQASIDLAPAIATVMSSLAEVHRDLHKAMPPQVSGEIAIGAVDRAIGAAADELIGTLLDKHHRQARSPHVGGWWDSLTHAVSSAVTTVTKDAAHYALHPSDIARDVAGHLGAGKTLANALSYVTDPLQPVTENSTVQSAAASYFGGPAGVAALQAARTAEGGGVNLSNIGQTIKSFAPEIAQAAQHAAGVSGGSTASSLAGALVNATAGKGGAQNLAQSFVKTAAKAAKSNPHVKKALAAAKAAVSHVAAAQHVAVTADQASTGNPSATQQVSQIAKAASSGDSGAQNLIKTATSLASSQGLDLSSIANAIGGIL